MKLRPTFAAAGIVFLIVLAAAPLAGAGAEKPETVPNPLSTAGRYVGDGAGILGAEYIGLIDGVCKALKNATTSEMAVITVADLGGTTIEDFAVRLFQRFGIGQKGKDNGILILCALAERDVRVEVGYGLEPVITDAKSTRIMNEEALPFLRKNEFGRGLYALAKGLADEIARTDKVSLGAADPAAWPTQVEIAKMDPAAKTKPASGRSGGEEGPLIYIGLVLAWGILGLVLTFFRVKSRRALAARRRAINGSLGLVQTILWLGAGGGFFILLGTGTGFGTALLSALAPIAATIGQVKWAGFLKRGLQDYRLPCAKCGQPMDLMPEDQDDALLTVEEAAEEKAGGMDYEIWSCSSCGAQERLSVKLNKASSCPQCQRRTLNETRTILVAATTSQGGRVRVDRNCRNPKCGYAHTEERSTPRIQSSSSSGHGSGGSSGSSFGGGRSGGGGSTGHF